MMLAVVVVAAMCMAGLWLALGLLGPWGSQVMTSGLVGVASVAAVMLAGVFIMTPWKPKPVADWMTFWMAATVFRLLLTPVVIYVIYSAASPALAVKPLVLSVAAAYFVILLSEASVVACHVRRSCPSP